MRDRITTAINDQLKTATTNYTETNTRVLDGVVEVNRKMVDFAVKTVDQVADRFTQQAPANRLADRLPTPAETGERYLDVVERLVELNRDFSDRVVAMLPADVKVAPKAAAKPAAAAKKPVAKKTPAKKTAKKAPVRKAAAKK